MNCIEVVGGIKQEPKLIKEEYEENDANAVEISLEDIIGKEQVRVSKETEALEDENICPEKDVLQKEGVVSKHDRNEDRAKTVNIEHANHRHEMNDGNKVLYIRIERIIDKIEPIKKKNILISSSKHALSGEPNSSCNENNLDNKEGILKEGQNIKEQEEKEVLHINFTAGNDIPQPPNKQRNISSKVRKHEIIFEAPDRFICVYCKAVRSKKTYANEHIRMHHRENVRMRQCPHCPYKSKHYMKYHLISIHTALDEVEWFCCHQCDSKFKLKTQLRAHIYVRHLDPMFYGGLRKCTVCDKGFKRDDNLRKHMLRIHDEGPHRKKGNVCQICNYSTTVKAQLENHIDIHHTDINKLETIKCDECKYTTKYKHRFHAHKRRRHSQKTLQCHICAYQTNSSTLLKLHLISHQEDKKEEDLKFKCTECSYKTYRQNNLLIHEIKHKKPSEIQYFQCYHCPFKANRKDNLKSHIFRHYKQNDVIKHLNKHSKKKK